MACKQTSTVHAIGEKIRCHAGWSRNARTIQTISHPISVLQGHVLLRLQSLRFKLIYIYCASFVCTCDCILHTEEYVAEMRTTMAHKLHRSLQSPFTKLLSGEGSVASPMKFNRKLKSTCDRTSTSMVGHVQKNTKVQKYWQDGILATLTILFNTLVLSVMCGAWEQSQAKLQPAAIFSKIQPDDQSWAVWCLHYCGRAACTCCWIQTTSIWTQLVAL